MPYNPRYPPVSYQEPQKRVNTAENVCPNLNIFGPANLFTSDFPITRTHKMSLIQEAERVAAQFDYPAEAVNKGVKEFIREMGLFMVGPSTFRRLF